MCGRAPLARRLDARDAALRAYLPAPTTSCCRVPGERLDDGGGGVTAESPRIAVGAATLAAVLHDLPCSRRRGCTLIV